MPFVYQEDDKTFSLHRDIRIRSGESAQLPATRKKFSINWMLTLSQRKLQILI